MLNVILDILGVALVWRLAVPQIVPAGIGIFLSAFFAVSWFIGAYFYLRWPLMPKAQVALRLLLTVLVALAISLVLVPWVMPRAEPMRAVPLAWLAALFGVWAGLHRGWLSQMVRKRILGCLAGSRVYQAPKDIDSDSTGRELILMLVAYHPEEQEVEQLQCCLAGLPSHIGYAVVVNDYRPGEPVDRLAQGADCFLINHDNPGYGRSVNRLFSHLVECAGSAPPYIGVLNTDLSWGNRTFSKLLSWLQVHPDVSLAVPQIVDPGGAVQRLCKRNPTILALMSRRFIPESIKPGWLKAYDQNYVMCDRDYLGVFEAPYLSGCCMLIRTESFVSAGGFDERYFLYLEDADITRTLSYGGRCVHLPIASVVHAWGRGNYRSLRLAVVNLISAWHYFKKWGWALW